MKDFDFYSPTRIVFGNNSHLKTGAVIKETGAKKVLILYGQGSVVKSGLLEQIEAQMRNADMPYVALGGVQPNPVLSFVRRGISLCQDEQVDFILAVGGGSVIDTAKAIALGVQNPNNDVWDFFIRKADARQPAEIRIQIGCVLTIAAAGSEAGGGTVIVNDEQGASQKRSCNYKSLYPVASFLNPAFLATVPIYHLRCSVADILMHTMERFFTPTTGNELTDRFALSLLSVVMENGRKLIGDPANYDAATEIMWASTLSHNGLTGLGGAADFSTHQMSHELSGVYGAIHGAALTAVWGSWARYVMDVNPARFAAFGEGLWPGAHSGQDGRDTALASVEKMEEFFAGIGMPLSIPELLGKALQEDELAYIADQCAGSRNTSQKVIGSFKVLGYEDIIKIYQMANVKK